MNVNSVGPVGLWVDPIHQIDRGYRDVSVTTGTSSHGMDPPPLRPNDLTTIPTPDAYQRPCLHESCPHCRGGRIANCIHSISCPCPKCSPVVCRTIQ